MPRNKEIWSWIVFVVSAGAYLPIMWGGWHHPREINVASFSIWLIISSLLLYSTRDQGFAGWRLALAFFLGNGSLVVEGLLRGGYTFNLGPAEVVALYGVIMTLSIWVAVGTITKKWQPRILYLGGVSADILSFYPQLKQYLLPHESPTPWMIIGWCMFIASTAINVIMVEEMFKKLFMHASEYAAKYEKPKRPLLILEESIFSLENCLFVAITVVVMVH